uniref:Uncharacterized protein n=1 Tax=Salix viminalis TaxID=40686 RepID=A0A6N2N9L8_SALVM
MSEWKIKFAFSVRQGMFKLAYFGINLALLGLLASIFTMIVLSTRSPNSFQFIKAHIRAHNFLSVYSITYSSFVSLYSYVLH